MRGQGRPFATSVAVSIGALAASSAAFRFVRQLHGAMSARVRPRTTATG